MSFKKYIMFKAGEYSKENLNAAQRLALRALTKIIMKEQVYRGFVFCHVKADVLSQGETVSETQEIALRYKK